MRMLYLMPFLMLLGGTQSVAGLPDGETDEARLAVALKGLSPGNPQNCINLHETRDMARFGDKVVYRVGRKLAYVTDTGGGCYGLDQGDAFVTETITGQLCRGDIAHTVDLISRTDSGSCVIGEFTPYRANP